MSDEPTLPRLPAVSWDERSQSFSNNPRKRGRLTHASNAPSSAFNSSDPAVFSSDDDPAIDNYVEGRKKRRYVGSWFNQHPASSDSTFGDTTFGDSTPNPRPKRTWSRQVDSGVFLASDDAESETMSECPPMPSQSRLRQLEVRPRRRVNPAELQAQRRIRECVEAGTEDVVLYSAGLTELSNETVAPLSHLQRIPIVGRDVAFEQHLTQIRLNLASNALTKLPGTLFDISTLTMLTLRGNNLEELPACIGKLRNLQSLNVSQNRLKYLPMELLNLFKNSTRSSQWVLHPNPFLEPPDQSLFKLANNLLVKGTSEDPHREPEHGQTPLNLATQCLGWSSPQALDLGRYLTQDRSSKDGLGAVARWYDKEGNIQQNQDVPFASDGLLPVPSLLELALRSCYSTDHLLEMQAMLQDGPPQLQALLERAHELKQAGGVQCSRCKRTMVVPASEWVEWRALFELDSSSQVNWRGGPAHYHPHSTAPSERAVPFMYRACSGRCGTRVIPESRWVVGEGWEVDETHPGLWD
ncbi:hypothetical protein NLU13_3919 [Sarocladium strictum]|uniref:Uncharacterized protein n=1 Tax=Sarocladium strictum TaxID=5046 RepID=A0AA39GIQ4_SARSR|nr:hypothetical protein NLU13_3919 [Sarocladium strictum]